MFRICNILLYLIFALYPTMHLHTHDHHAEVEVHLCVQPADVPMACAATHHNHCCEVSHKDSHFSGNWIHIVKLKSSESKNQTSESISINPFKHQPLNTHFVFEAILHQFSSLHLSLTVPDRAPPAIA